MELALRLVEKNSFLNFFKFSRRAGRCNRGLKKDHGCKFTTIRNKLNMNNTDIKASEKQDTKNSIQKLLHSVVN